MNQSDPTDHALATIASILERPRPQREPDKAVPEKKPDSSAGPEADGYSKVGPGPMESVRFKWTVRHDGNGQYFVDETVGENSQPLSSGPMSADAAVRFVDDHASEARQRFEALRSEMAGRAAAADMVRKDSGDT